MKKNTYSGPKHRGDHRTFIDAAERLIRWGDRDSAVVGISPGFITNKRSSRQITVKVIPLSPKCLAVHVVGGGSKQVVTLYTTGQDDVEAAILALYP